MIAGNLNNMGTNNAFWWQATSSTNLLVYSGGTLDGTVDMPDVGDVMRIKRAGEVWTLEYDDGGDGNFKLFKHFQEQIVAQLFAFTFASMRRQTT